MLVGATPIAIPVEAGEQMPGWTFSPAAPSRGACLVAPDIYGPSPFYAELARMLAAAGFTATMVDYFFREGPLTEQSRDAAFARRTRFDEQRALRDLSAAADRLGPASGRTGLIGFCLAGQFALDLSAQRRDLATVCFYPFPEGAGGDVRVAAPRPIDLAGEMTGPIVAFWGAADYIPPSVIDRFGKAMRDAGTDYTQHIYDGAGHGFLQGLIEDRPDSEQACDAWRISLHFLNSAGLGERS